MDVLGNILANPSGWTGERVVQELPLRMYDDPRRWDPALPGWLRVLMDICDFDTHIQMEGLLGWWENRAAEDLSRMIAAFESIGLPDQAVLLTRASEVLDPSALGADASEPEFSVSSFAERHPWLDDEQYRRFAELEEQLYLNFTNGPDLYAALVAYTDAWLNASY